MPEAAGISVVICCHDSAARIGACLQHLGRQQLPPTLPWEILIVDNASRDDTAGEARRCWEKLATTTPLRITAEPQLGLHHARRRGLREARHELIVFVDDDNWLAPDFLATASTLMQSKPEVGACGGRGLAQFETAEPAWFHRFQSAYAVGPQQAESGEIDPSRGYLFGAGLCLRRSLALCMADHGFALHNAGRTGSLLGAGDDAELCLAIRLAGWRLWYDARLVFRHLIPAPRLETDYLKRLHAGFGRSAPILDAYRIALGGPLPLGQLRHSWPGAALFYFCALAAAALLLALPTSPRSLRQRRLTLVSHTARLIGLLQLRGGYARLQRQLREAPWQYHCRPDPGREVCGPDSATLGERCP